MGQAAVQRPPARFDASVVPGAKPAPFPGFVEPCHPTLREKAPSDERWLHEIKFNGGPTTWTSQYRAKCLHQVPWGLPRPSRGFEVLAPSSPGRFCKARRRLQQP